MTIRTIDEYKDFIDKGSKPSPKVCNGDMRYFVAGFVGATNSARKNTKENQSKKLV